MMCFIFFPLIVGLLRNDMKKRKLKPEYECSGTYWRKRFEQLEKSNKKISQLIRIRAKQTD